MLILAYVTPRGVHVGPSHSMRPVTPTWRLFRRRSATLDSWNFIEISV